MESFLTRYKNGLVLMAVLLTQLIFLALQVRRPMPGAPPDAEPVRLLRYWMVTLITPPARVSHGAGLSVRGLWSNYIDLRNVRQRNLDLQAEIERLRLEEGAIAEDARQGQRLQQLEGFKEHYVYTTATAQVIGTAGTDRSRVIIIDKGARNGVAVDMPVITPDGIVGKVREVFPHSAQVLEISDPSSGAGVMLETTRIRGVLRGNAFGQPEIINIMPDDRIKPGERVMTSGGDQIFPRGLPVGVVDHVATDPERNPYVDVVIKPGANLARLEEVLVVTGMGDQLPAADQGELAQSEAEAQRHSAAQVLSEKLPSIREPDAPDAAATDASAADGKAADAVAASPDAKPTLPPRPPAPLHGDRFTPGAAPSAMDSLPGVAATVPPHKSTAKGVASPTGRSNPDAVAPETTIQDAAPSGKAVEEQPGNATAPAVPNTLIPKKKVAAPGTEATTPLARTGALQHPSAMSPQKSSPTLHVEHPAHAGPVAPAGVGQREGLASSPPKPGRLPTYVEPYFVKQPHASPDSGKPLPARTVPPAGTNPSAPAHRKPVVPAPPQPRSTAPAESRPQVAPPQGGA